MLLLEYLALELAVITHDSSISGCLVFCKGCTSFRRRASAVLKFGLGISRAFLRGEYWLATNESHDLELTYETVEAGVTVAAVSVLVVPCIFLTAAIPEAAGEVENALALHFELRPRVRRAPRAGCVRSILGRILDELTTRKDRQREGRPRANLSRCFVLQAVPLLLRMVFCGKMNHHRVTNWFC